MDEVLAEGQFAFGPHRRHLGAGARAAGGAVEGAGPGQRPVPVELAGRDDHRVAPVRSGHERRRRELADRHAADLRIQLMHRRRQLLLAGRLDHLADPGRLRGLFRRQGEADLVGVGDDVEHAAVGDVDGHVAEFRHVEHRVEVDGEGGHVLELDPLHLAPFDVGAHPDQAGGRFQGQFGDGLRVRHHPGLDQHGDDGDRVRARHAGVLDLLHDHVAGDRVGMGRRQDQVAVRGRIAARFAQHPQAQLVGFILEVAHLLEHRRPGDVEDAADDHPARFAADVRVDGVDDVGDPHRGSSSRPLAG